MTNRREIKRQAAKDAAHAHSDLNTFGAVISLLEGGHIYCPASYNTKQKIIKLCQNEMQKRLEDYDYAVDVATS